MRRLSVSAASEGDVDGSQAGLVPVSKRIVIVQDSREASATQVGGFCGFGVR